MDVEELLEDYRRTGDVPTLKPPSRWNNDFTLRPYQKVGAAHLAVKRRFILGDPTGSGKTPQQLFAYGLVLDDRNKRGKVLILLPSLPL